ncbi:MAG TPA: YafY family protein [Acidimicrobiales bacterium]|jgi:predicted DNA-binding transcriptional regulator YafY|nr:YafY family protein [Acidimicrobiales bacterium]
MSDSAGRMLALLALLQHRPTWTGIELAERLAVTDRTVRRDVDRLRQLGYPVEAAPGAYGGYQLGRGGKLPPLLLGDDEAMAVALGLRAAVDGSVTGLEEAAVSVLARLDDLLPHHLATRVRALHEATAHLDGPSAERVPSEVLVALGQGCARCERIRFAYADRAGRASERLVEPYRLVRVGPRWYLVGRDIDRRDWRTFRVDRLSRLERVGTTFTFDDPPDAVALVRRGLRVRVYPYEARLRVAATAEEVAELMPSAIAIVEADGPSTVVDVGSTSAQRMVRYLAGLSLRCEVLAPADLRVCLRRHAERLAEANS